MSFRSQAPADVLQTVLLQLMFLIDFGYERLACDLPAPWVEALEVELETFLWDLEWALEDAEEGDDSDREPDVDDEPGVEEQLVRIWAEYADPRNPHYGGSRKTASGAILAVLEGACLPWQADGMAPSSLDVASDVDLLELAHSLHRDRVEHRNRVRRAPRRSARRRNGGAPWPLAPVPGDDALRELTLRELGPSRSVKTTGVAHG